MAITANGFVARDDDTTDFISDEEWERFESVAHDARCLVIGRRTYEVMQGDALSSFGDVDVVVVSTNGTLDCPEPNVTVVDTPQAAIAAVQGLGRNIAIVAGGAKLNAAFLQAGLVDEIGLDVEPLLLGQGIPLVAPVDLQVEMTLGSVTPYGSAGVHLRYIVEK